MRVRGIVWAMLSVVMCGAAWAQSDRQPPSRERDQRTSVIYSTLSTLPMANRRAVFAALAPEAKADVWISQLDRFSAAHPELSDEQRLMIAEAKSLIRSGLFEVDHSSPEWSNGVLQALSRLEDRVRLVFPPALGAMAFAQLGDPEPSMVATTTGHSGGLQSDILIHMEPCECNHEHSWCSTDYCGIYGCISSSWGCGLFWLYECNGLCRSY